MQIKKLTTWQEWLESDKIIGTAFLHKWNEKESREKFQAQAAGEKPRAEDAWGLFDDSGRMVSTIVTEPERLMFDGASVAASDVHMVGSLPEARGSGNIRALMRAVLEDFRSRGDVFATLFPFSFAFYRKFGFDLGSKSLRQKFPVDQLAGFRCDDTVRRVESQEDADLARALYERTLPRKNMAELRTDKDWNYRGGGEFGEPNWWFGDNQQYTYLFQNGAGETRAYLKFVFTPSKDGPMVGSMDVRELVYDSPDAFRSVLGFCYAMRAKVRDISMTLSDNVDLAMLLPECDKAERSLEGHRMVRALNAAEVLRRMRYPAWKGSMTLEIRDDFLAENTGFYAVAWENGKALSVEPGEGVADLTVTVQTFTQLAIGLIGLELAEYRDGTVLRGNREALEQVFRRKTQTA